MDYGDILYLQLTINNSFFFSLPFLHLLPCTSSSSSIHFFIIFNIHLHRKPQKKKNRNNHGVNLHPSINDCSSIPQTHNHITSRRHQWQSCNSLLRFLPIKTHLLSSLILLHYSSHGRLLILSPPPTLKSKINFHFKTLNPQIPMKITYDLAVNHCHSFYTSDHVCFITPRVLIVDLLTSKLLINMHNWIYQ